MTARSSKPTIAFVWDSSRPHCCVRSAKSWKSTKSSTFQSAALASAVSSCPKASDAMPAPTMRARATQATDHTKRFTNRSSLLILHRPFLRPCQKARPRGRRSRAISDSTTRDRQPSQHYPIAPTGYWSSKTCPLRRSLYNGLNRLALITISRMTQNPAEHESSPGCFFVKERNGFVHRHTGL